MDYAAHGGHDHDGHQDMNHGENLGSTIVSTIASVMDNMHSGHMMQHGMEGQDHSMGGDHGGMDHGGMDHGGMDHGGMDHGGMDHGGMDHGDMDHGGMDHGGMDHGGMKMWFHTGYSEIILFESWKINSIEGLIGSMVGIFLMATLYEGLKYYRQYLYWKTYNSVQYRSVTIPAEKGVTEDNQIVHMVGEVIQKQPPTLFSWMHAFQASLHLIQIVLSYFLMLIFMTYNVWLCMAVVLGAVLGYFLFGWKKPMVVDVTEHCH